MSKEKKEDILTWNLLISSFTNVIYTITFVIALLNRVDLTPYIYPAVWIGIISGLWLIVSCVLLPIYIAKKRNI